MKIKYQGIYKIRNLLNGKVYIGQSSNINGRFHTHKYKSNKGKKHPLCASMRKYGIDNFEFTVIEHINDKDKFMEREQYWISYYKANDKDFGYNLRTDCRTNRGCKQSAEARNKMSVAKKGVIPWNKGLKMSEEYCKTVSKALKVIKKKPRSDNEKKFLSDLMRANWNNQDFKEKIIVQIQEGFKKIIKSSEIFCIDCNRQLAKYEKSKRCLDCHNKNRKKDAKKWFCTDCGLEVERRNKRCKSCHTNYCSIRMKNWQANRKLKLLAS